MVEVIFRFYARKIFLTLIILFTAGCGKYYTTHEQLNIVPRKSSEDSFSNYDRQRETSHKELNLLYRLHRPTVGLAQFNGYEAPVLLPLAVHNANIIFQIYRCPAFATIQGAVSTYDDDANELNNENSARDYFKTNQFWNDIRVQCSEVSKAHPQIELIDLSAPSGDWRWYARACLPELESGNFTCSDVVTTSMPLLGFQNKLSASRAELLSRINQRITVIRQLSASFPNKAAALSEAYAQCNISDWDKTKRLLKRSVIANVIGYGSSILIGIFTPDSAQPSTPGRLWKDKIDLLWQPTVDVQKTGQAITRVLLWLFTTKDDFKETCSAAETIKITAAADLFKVKELQLMLATDLDEAQRIGLSLPEGFLP
jgi:hypothetical protein